MKQNPSVHEDTLALTYEWFATARPNPTQKDFSTQLGVHFEEVAEMVDSLAASTLRDQTTTKLLLDAADALEALGNHLKANEGAVLVKDPELFLDSICDQIVTGTGVAFTKGYDLVGAMDEVNRSNYSKFDADGKPIYNENRKVMKGPAYTIANLKPYL